jgi:hypothetical protein
MIGYSWRLFMKKVIVKEDITFAAVGGGAK